MSKNAEDVSKGFGCSAFSNYFGFQNHFCGDFRTQISAKYLRIKGLLNMPGTHLKMEIFVIVVDIF